MKVLVEQKKFWTRQGAMDFKAKFVKPNQVICGFQNDVLFYRKRFEVKVWEEDGLEESIKGSSVECWYNTAVGVSGSSEASGE